MPLWMWILLLVGLIKLVIAGLMLWIPFRHDEAALPVDVPSSSEEDGGSRALPGGPLDPHPHTPLPRKPRRDPHGSPSPAPPPRVRTTVSGKPPMRVCD